MNRPLALLAVLVCALSVSATPQLQTPAKTQTNGNPKTGFRAEFLTNLDDVQEKILELATAVPAEKYGWRPGEGVRSLGEVFMHVAGGNYFLATFLGKQPPADMPKDLERITDKQRVVAELRRSFEHVRSVVLSESDADLEKSVRMYGTQTTHRGVFVAMLNHLHEHLGQSIAYARMNRVVPPWSGR
jgi:uncharacterized damage-inducible protein DinB